MSRATHESSMVKSPIQSPVSASETEEESRDGKTFFSHSKLPDLPFIQNFNERIFFFSLFKEPRVLRIATKQVPLPSQPEVVLSDGKFKVDPTETFYNEILQCHECYNMYFFPVVVLVYC